MNCHYVDPWGFTVLILMSLICCSTNILIFTARVQSTRECTVFTGVSSHWGGYPIWLMGLPPSGLAGWGTPRQDLMGTPVGISGDRAATWRAVYLLRSRRRTFLSYFNSLNISFLEYLLTLCHKN